MKSWQTITNQKSIQVSEHTVGKVRRLAEDVEALRAEEAAEKKVAMMLKRTKMFIVELLKRLMMGDSFSLSPLWPQGEGKEKGSFFPKSWAQERNLNIIFASEWSTFKLSMEFSVVLLFKTYLNFLLLIFSHLFLNVFSSAFSTWEVPPEVKERSAIGKTSYNICC